MNTKQLIITASGIRDTLLNQQEAEIAKLQELAVYTLDFDENHQASLEAAEQLKRLNEKIEELEYLRRQMALALQEHVKSYTGHDYFSVSNTKESLEDIARSKVRKEYRELHPLPTQDEIMARILLEDDGRTEEAQYSYKDYVNTFK